MENKNNFAGIIIPVIIAVILLTVLPIINSINVECPPCEEIPSYNIGNLEVNPDFSSGDYIVDKGSYDYIDSVTIIKDENLIPENIKKDVNIFGVIGTLESGGELPFSYQGMGLLYVAGYHSNFSGSTSLAPQARCIVNDGLSDIYIEGTLISFKSGNYVQEINYSFIFLIPIDHTIKEFQLKSNIAWDIDLTSYVASSNSGGHVSSVNVSIENGTTTPNQFSKIFSFTTPQFIVTDKDFISVNLVTYKE